MSVVSEYFTKLSAFAESDMSYNHPLNLLRYCKLNPQHFYVKCHWAVCYAESKENVTSWRKKSQALVSSDTTSNWIKSAHASQSLFNCLALEPIVLANKMFT